MALRIDPEKNEVRALQQVTDWRGKRVLEVGCGDGRLTQRLARLGAHVEAIDPDAERIREARKNMPKGLRARVHYSVGNASKLKYRNGSFDLVVFSWVL
ncbi:MAG TPA: class I SAM-dependent methyltransferase [Anaerolineales bacterium]|jgi:2-polyprenyl-3-methyl-5-hydroxy-6-metoxy-1,4-benzoquinol methylase